MRILIAPFEVSGIAGGLKAGFDRIGVESELAFSQAHPFAYGSPTSRALVPRIWARLGQACFSSRTRAPARAVLLFAWRAWSLVVVAWALWRFDAFIFMFGNTLTNSSAEAWLLAKLRKRVVVIFCGSDVRPPFVDGWVHGMPKVATPEGVRRYTATIRRKISRYERHGFICVNSAFTAQFHNKPFVNWFAMGTPRVYGDFDGAGAGERKRESGAQAAVRVLHSPSNPVAKGTARIVEAVEQLKRSGLGIELILLQNVPNMRVQSEIAKADFVIDQLYSDSPMATFAAEAAWCGKPAIVAGYAAPADLKSSIGPFLPPTLYIHPDALRDAVEKMVVDAPFRTALAREARDFVRGRWSPEAVAKRYLRLLNGDVAAEWMVEPDSVIYVHGAGLAEDDARRFVGQLIDAAGPAALQLDDKPALRDAFVAFASSASSSASSASAAATTTSASASAASPSGGLAEGG